MLRAFLTGAVMISLIGCATPDGLLLNQTCPCLDGWTCNSEDVCIMGEGGRDVPVAVDGGTDSGTDSSVDAAADAPADTSADVPVDSGPEGPPPPLSTECWFRAGDYCDWTTPGFRFEHHPASNFSEVLAGNADFSPDGCSIYYSLNTDDLYRVDRAGPGLPFGAPILLEGVNTDDFAEDGPSLGPDGLELFFASNRQSGTIRRVYRSTRPSVAEPWLVGTPIPSINLEGTVGWEPRIAPHGLRLYLALDDGQQWVQVIERPSLESDFGPPTRLEILGLPAPIGPPEDQSTNRPSAAYHDRILTFVTQPDDNADNRLGYYMTRENWNDEWSTALLVPESFSTAGMRDLGISADGCELVIRTGRLTQGVLRYVGP